MDDVRVRYWMQDTMESGRWEVSGLMTIEQARACGAQQREQYHIVLDEEGWPPYEEG